MAYYLTLTTHVQVVSIYWMMSIGSKPRKVGHDLDLKFSL